MNRFAVAVVLALPTLALAQDRLPTPDYHWQPSDPAWLAQVVQLHGHLGPSVVAGARMGMIGLHAVGAKGYFDVVLNETPARDTREQSSLAPPASSEAAGHVPKFEIPHLLERS
jgi:hypothetical protein